MGLVLKCLLNLRWFLNIYFLYVDFRNNRKGEKAKSAAVHCNYCRKRKDNLLSEIDDALVFGKGFLFGEGLWFRFFLLSLLFFHFLFLIASIFSVNRIISKTDSLTCWKVAVTSFVFSSVWTCGFLVLYHFWCQFKLF